MISSTARAPFRARINPSHFGADINILFSKLDENSILIYYFGAGQKNNPSHGPVAQVTMAPMDIVKKRSDRLVHYIEV